MDESCKVKAMPGDPVVDVVELSNARRLIASGDARRIREAADVSCADLGRSIGVSAVTVSRWERGQVRPRSDAALKWAQVLEALAGSR